MCCTLPAHAVAATGAWGLRLTSRSRGEAERAASLRGTSEGIRAAHDVPVPTDEDGEEDQRTLAGTCAALCTAVAPGAFEKSRALTQSGAIQLARLA